MGAVDVDLPDAKRAMNSSRVAGALKPAEVDPAIAAAQAVDGPALIWFEIAEEQNVFPMMPAGKGLSDLIEKWEGADE